MTPPRRPRFVWDTSALIAAWVERYPIDVIPPLWEKFAAAIDAGEMVAPEEVAVELEKRSKDLLEFLKPHETFFVPTDATVIAEATAILAAHPKLVMERKRAYAADPFVIATAKIIGVTVVTEEGRGSPAKPKITDVCDAYGIAHIGVLDFIRKAGWKF